MTDLTLEDIAKQAGVSRSTVSRVVNQSPDVSEDVRTRVLRVIEHTGYQPHAAARALASQRSLTIGLLLPQSVNSFFTDPYFSHLTKGIAQACNQANYTLALFLVSTKADEEKIFPRLSRPGFVDGVIVQSGPHGEQSIISRFLDAKLPIVIAGRPFRTDNVSYIDVDNLNGAYTAVSHLIQLGRKRIGLIGGPTDSTAGIDRKEGYLRALRERGCEPEQALLADGDFTEVGGYYSMQRLLPAKPNAIFAASDVMALGAMRAVREAHLRIPEDIAFVGFDDLPISTLSDLHLTTVRQPVVQFGAKAVDILIDLIEHGIDPPRHIIMGTELVIRGSCGAIRGN